MARKKYTVWANGRVSEPFHLPVSGWFYASRGRFEIYSGLADVCMAIPTSLIRKALALVDSVKPRKRK